MPASNLNVILLKHTLAPEEMVALGARLCYAKTRIGQLREKVSATDQAAFVQKIMGMGHESVLEHVSFTFGVEGVSRVLLAQLTRHRLASFSVQSQRYVSYQQGFGYIIPPNIAALGADAIQEYEGQMAQIQHWYEQWQQRLGKGEGANEDARFVLPGACETRLMMTMNARELRHFFKMRMCLRAQWEIRAMAEAMHRLVMEVAPALFSDAGAACLRGKCPEGEKCCGQQVRIRQERAAWLKRLHTQTAE